MTDVKSDACRVIGRIAEALGTDVSDLYGEGDPMIQRARESFELISIFEMLEDAGDRRACLDFVRATAARGRL